MEVVAFKAEHLNYLLETGISDTKLSRWLLPENGLAFEKVGGVYSILENGKPVVCGGIFKYWENRGEAWLIFGKPSTQKFNSIFKIVKHFISISPLQRIEMVIDYEFEEGHRWARLLGFKKEGERLQKYRPEGGDVTLYAKVRS